MFNWMRNPVVAGVICSVITLGLAWALKVYVVVPLIYGSDTVLQSLIRTAAMLGVIFFIGWLIDRRAAKKKRPSVEILPPDRH